MELVPIATLAALLFVKEVGVPVPVPGDLLVVGAGVSTSGRTEALAWLAAILLAGFAGGCVQFLLMRGPMRRPILGLLSRIGLGERRLGDLAGALSRRGSRGVAIARATPGLRMTAIAASALAGLPFGVFLRGLIAGNTIFVGGHFALGFLVGAPATRVAGALASPATLAIVILALAIVGAVGWMTIRNRRPAGVSSASGESRVMVPLAVGSGGTAAAAWADAACPICLSIALTETRVVQPRRAGVEG